MMMAASCLPEGSNYKTSYPVYATFEYSMDYEKEFGADSLCFNDAANATGFGFDVLGFQHKLNAPKTDVDGGFILSYLATPSVFEITDTLKNNQYRAYDSKYKSKNTYAVYKVSKMPDLMPEHDVIFTQKQNGTCTMNGCYVTNTIETAKAVMNGFEKGDRLVLKATGYLDGKMTKEARINLADFSAQKDSVVCTWTAFDLSSLGSVEYVDFELESTKQDIPLGFCMDIMVAQVSLEY